MNHPKLTATLPLKKLRQEIVKEKLNLKTFFHFIATADKVKTTIKKPINSATGKTYWIFVTSYYYDYPLRS